MHVSCFFFSCSNYSSDTSFVTVPYFQYSRYAAFSQFSLCIQVSGFYTDIYWRSLEYLCPSESNDELSWKQSTCVYPWKTLTNTGWLSFSCWRSKERSIDPHQIFQPLPPSIILTMIHIILSQHCLTLGVALSEIEH